MTSSPLSIVKQGLPLIQYSGTSRATASPALIKDHSWAWPSAKPKTSNFATHLKDNNYVNPVPTAIVYSVCRGVQSSLCLYCQENHALKDYHVLLMEASKRICFGCLSGKHVARVCTEQKVCKIPNYTQKAVISVSSVCSFRCRICRFQFTALLFHHLRLSVLIIIVILYFYSATDKSIMCFMKKNIF